MMQRSSRPVEQTGGPFLFKTRPPLVANPPAHIEPPADRRNRLLALLNRHHKAHSLVHGTGLLPPHRQGPPCRPVDLLPMSPVYSVTHVAGQDPAAHPPLEGEDRFACSEAECEPRWGDAAETVPLKSAQQLAHWSGELTKDTHLFRG